MSSKAMDDSLNEPLMGREEDDPIRRKTTRLLFKAFFTLQTVTICLLPILYFLGYRHGSQKLPKLPTDPVSKDGYKLQLQQLDDAFLLGNPENKKFKGVPRPELDDAWSGMLKHMNIRVYPDEARNSLNFSSIGLNDGSGDLMGMPTVFHGLHCLKTIREFMFPEAYPESYEQFQPPAPGGIHRHMDHCIENLRQAIMCQGDMSLYTYRWLPEQDEPDIIAGMDHVCADFDTIMEWAEERSFSLNDGLLSSPYRDGPWDPSSLGHDH